MIGKRLKKLRGNRTQDEIAGVLGISRSRYSHYENERVEPDLDLLQKMASYFDVSIDYLSGNTDVPKGELTELERKFLKDVVELSDDEIMAKLTYKGKPIPNHLQTIIIQLLRANELERRQKEKADN